MSLHLIPHQPGPDVTDGQLAAWRDAATTGALPAPHRTRWVPLRAGAIGMWEFDVAEYWFADGRAQLVGQNQSGKSTLMTLTTLIMLQGETRQHLIDTFGEVGKRFRYYVEPSGHPKDRRDASSSTNRGWVWVEYGRITDDGTPEFFTCLLYAQAKRGVQDVTTTWITCRGSARVRAGIDLAAGQAAYEPKHLVGIEGLLVHDSGRTGYAGYVATQLFGITDPDRYRTVLTMLRSLRTPNLGKILDADFFTGQIRSALPALDRDEVAELAGSWQQVEQLGADRDHAEVARAAITGYVNRLWRPWADAVLRLAADTLLDADVACDRAHEAVTAAKAALDAARDDLTAESKRTGELISARESAQASYNQLLQSAAYGSALGRADDARRLRDNATTAKRHADDARNALTRATAEHDQARAGQERATAALDAVRATVTAAIDHTITAAAAAGLGPHAPVWAGDGDLDRLDAAVADRRRLVGRMRALMRTAAEAAATWQSADNVAGQRNQESTDRQEMAARAAEELTDALQELSDRLERWAVGLGDDAPPVALREQWLQQVTAQATTARPRQVLAAMLNRQWLDPAVTPLAQRASQLRADATAALARAHAALDDADELERATDPQPAVPAGWHRRDRPAPSPAGAPLWRLIDPVDGLEPEVLDRLEAALAAAGLLDAWVTNDGLWAATRDGDDVVITAGEPIAGDSLAQVLRPAADAPDLTATVTAILAGIGYTSGTADLAAPVAVASDGRFQTPALQGRAGRAAHGAELLGAAARAAARRRQIVELRELAKNERAAAQVLSGDADQLDTRIAMLREANDNAPTDVEVSAAATALAAANTERDRAQQLHLAAAAAAAKLQGVAEDANGQVAAFAADHDLPTTPEPLEVVSDLVNAAAQAVSGLGIALAEQGGAERSAAAATTALEQATDRLGEAETTVHDLAAEAVRAAERAAEAEKSIDQDDKELFARKDTLQQRVSDLDRSINNSHEEGKRLASAASTAESAWKRTGDERDIADRIREQAFTAWWVPVDAGLAAARNLPAPHDGRDLADALEQARAARQNLRPTNWPHTTAEKTARVNALMSRVVGNQVAELQSLLESAGGRAITVVEADDSRPLPQVLMTVDASGQQYGPTDAIRQLDDLVVELSASHDELLSTMYTELLSSTFVEHLTDRLKSVITLLDDVNTVLAQHPTGADRMTLRLRRHPAADHVAGFKILKAIEDGAIASQTAQEQIRLFLADRLEQAKELPAGTTNTTTKPGADEWIDRVATLLDYRAWFDIVCEFRVAAHDNDPTRWKALTKQEHTTDSGGGKAVTLLQPLLATLVTLYSDSPLAPRPLWLDEAFVGVDARNQATMMKMLVGFDLDFMLAGPDTLVTSAQVPAAAIWHVARAPAPLPGVDLSLTLWAGNTRYIVPVADVAAQALQPTRPVDPYAGPDLFTDLTFAGSPETDEEEAEEPGNAAATESDTVPM
ncbi:chemotaxis protein [Couchioplanes caeruleus]|uniref:SbcC/MukB-like Walker B domain-containing protein n=1 Tax=Couchioplanes caeruleus TaxID=56438 RepID=UPI0020BE48F9|nr:SbcC/MukB-like Walker B domain-containing protein [Couchioplanes caeruleus]UQU62531.1 chemotaxis protein [Couchioplanes caeruleus]